MLNTVSLLLGGKLSQYESTGQEQNAFHGHCLLHSSRLDTGFGVSTFDTNPDMSTNKPRPSTLAVTLAATCIDSGHETPST